MAFASAGLYEAHTSLLQAVLFSRIAERLSYKIGSGANERIVVPTAGPFNEQRGYTRIPELERRLRHHGFHVVEQARQSLELESLARWGITPPYHEPASVGLLIRGEDATVVYDAASGARLFSSYESIPPLIARTLLFVENRELEDSNVSTRNPVVDWGRSAKGGLLYAAHNLGLPFRIEGGSTLATQIQKFRYSEGGRTHSLIDKLRQMIGASLRAYRSGPDTTVARREIVLDYLNSLPLAAATGYGEVHGLGNGLYAWFGIELDNAMTVMESATPANDQGRILKHILALICAARAPSYYLRADRLALEARVDYYVRQLEAAGALPSDLAQSIRSAPLEFLDRAPTRRAASYIERKAVNAIRAHVQDALGIANLYTLDRLHLDAEATLNAKLQEQVLNLFEKLKDPAFVDAQGLRQQHLLSRGNPADVTYSFTLFERSSLGNVLRVQADTLNQPFDLNEGMKLELGSTAKVRTLAHYLEIVASLYDEYADLDSLALAARARTAADPITRWVLGAMQTNTAIDLGSLLEKALDRKYSASSGEVFFTGGGAHVFGNFAKDEDGKAFTLREGLKHSVNLVYIRLMRDLVRFHEARLPYDSDAVLNRPDNPDRLKLLKEIAAGESEHFLRKAYGTYRGLSSDDIVKRVLSNRAGSARHLAIVFLAWNPATDADELRRWLHAHDVSTSAAEAARLWKAYDPTRLNISDYGYLLNRHPLDLWCAGQLMRNPDASWDELFEGSVAAREQASRWLFRTKNKHAQDRRLRIRFERDAFERMTPYWQRLGFPFNRLVPSLATAIGSSADRPMALAELMGIILNDGIRAPLLQISRLRFAARTPYETVFEPDRQPGERVLHPMVARAMREVLADVVNDGTALRLAGAFVGSDGKTIVAGGKTGSGDNRFETFGRGGHLKSSRAVSRTGTFTFYIDDRYFGVLTAYVGGERAENYRFTSALPVAAMKLLAPAITASLTPIGAENSALTLNGAQRRVSVTP